jgi:hypothetical protein
MNWKHLLIGFVAGWVVTSAAFQVAAKRKSGYVLHSFEVRTLDAESGSPVSVGVKFPSHPDFTYSTAEPQKAVLSRTEHGGESGITRAAWLGTASADAYEFTLFADGYEDVVVPANLIDTTSGVSTGSVRQPETLLMTKAEQGADDQLPARAEPEAE